MKKQPISKDASPVKIHPKPSLALNKGNLVGGTDGAAQHIRDLGCKVRDLLNKGDDKRGNDAEQAIWASAVKAAVAEADRQGVNLVEVDTTISSFRGS